MARKPIPSVRIVKPTAQESDALRVGRVGFMDACLFLSFIYMSERTEVFTYDVPTAAADGRRCMINPAYFAKLRPGQRIFLLAHEEDHNTDRHPQRFTHYAETKGPDGQPFDWELANISADYVINARLVAAKIGDIHPNWLLHPDVKGDELWEDVYRRMKKAMKKHSGSGHMPIPKDGNSPANSHGYNPGKTPGGIPTTTAGKHAGSAPPDKTAQEAGGQIGDVYSPALDPITGREDIASDMSHKETVARAAAAARQMGKLPACYELMVEELLSPQIVWSEHIRLEMTGHIGHNSETWTKLNRRRICLNPMMGLPGRRGFGCDTLVVGLDTSGSIFGSPKALETYFSEMGGIIADCRPRRLVIVQCDAAIQKTDDVRTLDEVQLVRATGVKGGGGTSFVPVFEWCEAENIKPDMLIYLTDMFGVFPDEAPGYPVLWCSSSEVDTAPFGVVIQVEIDEEG